MADPFLSLAIITYQSEKTVAETLASLENLKELETVELILFDDASRDATRELVSKWVDKNRKLFHSVQTIFSDRNLGISRAHTRAFAEAKGVWGTYLGGDDLLRSPSRDFFLKLKTALQDVKEHLVRLRVKEYWSETGTIIDYFDSYSFLIRLSARRQYRYLASSGYPFRSGPGTVFRLDTLRALDGFGTYNLAFEDWQLYLRFTRNGYRAGFLDLEGVLWRRHPGQVSATGAQKFALGNALVKRKEIIPYLDRLSLFERWKFRFRGRISSRLHVYYQKYLGLWGRLFGVRR
ncbi:MAG: glycosyltransferase family 2 protein [Spirochaetales bacterium]|nr:glycosyltransferase family 2 protein [Spirochaetales bacterium]